MTTPLQEALMEADRQTERAGYVWQTLRAVVAELERLGIPYTIVDGIALQHFGLQRSTQDVDFLVGSPADLERLHQKLVGHGFARKSPESRHLRDEITRVRVEFLISGEFPGDGQPKPVQFPDPRTVAERSSDGLLFINLEKLIELKLASAISAPHRIKDRSAVLELIHLHQLPADYADRLDPYVQAAFRELAALPPPSDLD